IQPEVGGALHRPGLHVAVAGAGVVRPHRFADLAAEQLAQRLPHRLAEDVPEREVDRRAAAHLGAAAAVAEVADQVRLVPFDVARVLAHEVRRDGLVHVRFGGLRAVEGLAQADQAFVGMQAHPQDVGMRIQAYGLDLGDLHLVSIDGRYRTAAMVKPTSTPPGRLRACAEPPWNSAIRRTRYRPSPRWPRAPRPPSAGARTA